MEVKVLQAEVAAVAAELLEGLHPASGVWR